MPSIAAILKDELLNDRSRPFIDRLRTTHEASWFVLPIGDDWIVFVFADYSFLIIRDGNQVTSGELPPEEFQDFLIESVKTLGVKAIRELSERKLAEVKENRK